MRTNPGRFFKLSTVAFVLLLTYLVSLTAAQTLSVNDLQRSFARPPDDSRIMMRWWWFGPAVTKPELDRELRLMKEGGIGGFEVQPVYPVALDDEAAGIKTLPFLSDEFIEALRFTSGRARELGLRFDLTLGSGWPFGGPYVPISQAAGKLRFERVKPEGGSRRVKLPDIGNGEKFIAAFLVQTQGEKIVAADQRQLTRSKTERCGCQRDWQGRMKSSSLSPAARECRSSVQPLVQKGMCSIISIARPPTTI